MDQLLEILHHVRALGVPPLALVIVAALLAALIEQRLLHRRTPDFSKAYHDIDAVRRPPPPMTGNSRR